MQIDELKDDEMYCLTAPDGSLQLTTLSPDFATCVAIVKMLHKHGMSQSLSKMLYSGFKIMPVRVTITSNGDEESGYQDAKNDLSRPFN
jgi:hypothetical protein